MRWIAGFLRLGIDVVMITKVRIPIEVLLLFQRQEEYEVVNIEKRNDDQANNVIISQMHKQNEYIMNVVLYENIFYFLRFVSGFDDQVVYRLVTPTKIKIKLYCLQLFVSNCLIYIKQTETPISPLSNQIVQICITIKITKYF